MHCNRREIFYEHLFFLPVGHIIGHLFRQLDTPPYECAADLHFHTFGWRKIFEDLLHNSFDALLRKLYRFFYFLFHFDCSSFLFFLLQSFKDSATTIRYLQKQFLCLTFLLLQHKSERQQRFVKWRRFETVYGLVVADDRNQNGLFQKTL